MLILNFRLKSIFQKSVKSKCFLQYSQIVTASSSSNRSNFFTKSILRCFFDQRIFKWGCKVFLRKANKSTKNKNYLYVSWRKYVLFEYTREIAPIKIIQI